MLGLITFNAFNNAIDKLVHQLESLKVVLINRLDGAPVVVYEKISSTDATSNPPLGEDKRRMRSPGLTIILLHQTPHGPEEKSLVRN
ncbi:hypothetical protein F0726_02596 [Acidithiobacillus caldus]|nr:hypothetical protein F0726_02596 [Acidithiobacillus caldus]